MEILLWPDAKLKQKCDPVPMTPEALAEAKAQLALMAKTMYRAGGIGLAANQVGILKRMFVAWGPGGHALTFINPRILKFSGEWKMLPEGCLSVPGLVERTRRCTEVFVEATDANTGALFASVYTGRDAHVIQHEMEHLDGRIFLDQLPKGAMDKVRAFARKQRLAGKR